MENQEKDADLLKKIETDGEGLDSRKNKIEKAIPIIMVLLIVFLIIFEYLFYSSQSLKIQNSSEIMIDKKYDALQNKAVCKENESVDNSKKIIPDVANSDEVGPYSCDTNITKIYFPEALLIGGWDWTMQGNGKKYPYPFGVYDGYMKVGGFYTKLMDVDALEVVYYYDKKGNKINIKDKENCSLDFILEDASPDLEEKLKAASKDNPVELELKGLRTSVEGSSASLRPAGEHWKEEIEHVENLFYKDSEERSRKLNQ